jgi:hypothetical protein
MFDAFFLGKGFQNFNRHDIADVPFFTKSTRVGLDIVMPLLPFVVVVRCLFSILFCCIGILRAAGLLLPSLLASYEMQLVDSRIHWISLKQIALAVDHPFVITPLAFGVLGTSIKSGFLETRENRMPSYPTEKSFEHCSNLSS